MNLDANFNSQKQEPALTLQIEGLANATDVVLEGFAAGLRPPPPLDFTEWASQNVEFGPESPFPGKYNPALFPFFKEILECLQPDHPCREVVVMKSAQIGGTVVAQVFAGASLDRDPSPVLYVHPTIDNGLRWIRTKWNPFVRQSPALKKLFSYEKTRDASNTTLYKERKDQRGHLLVSGANSAASLSMVSFPRQIQDDLAKWEHNDSGDPESQADKRSQAFEWAKILKNSTPHIKGACRITKAWERSDQRLYMVPCPECEHFHALDWENIKQSLHDDMDPAGAHFFCPKCGAAIEHHHKEAMIGSGKWIPQNPGSKVPGFYIWSAYSLLISWSRIAEEWIKAKDVPEAEHNFMNDVVGLAYEQKGEAPPWKEIRDRAGGYKVGEIPADALILTLGVDCQGDRVEWLLKGFGPDHKRYTIQNGVIEGHISEDRAQKSLDALLRREWKNMAGRYLPADMLAIDGNYDTELVMDWAKRWPEKRVIVVRGGRGEHAPPLVPVKRERRSSGKVVVNQKRFWTVGVSALKAALYKQLEKKDAIQRGFCGFPEGLDDEYFIQLTAEKRMIKHLKGGFVQVSWEKLPGVRNEILDMELYAEAAARRLGWTQLSDKDWEHLRATRCVPPPEQQLDLLDASMAKPETQRPQQTDAPPPPRPMGGRRMRSRGIGR